MPLAVAYRPVTWKDVVGQDHVKAILKAMVAQQSLPPSIILCGSRGSGKTSIARILAAALNCPEPPTPGDACGTCASCLSVQSTNSLSVLEVDAAANGGVDEVRRIRDICRYTHEGLWRVVVLDEAHSASRDAFNALLKILEEPPPNTLFVLVTTEVEKILDTVRSRSMCFEFRRHSVADITTRLQHIATVENIPVTTDLLELLAIRAQGALRDAVLSLEQIRAAGITTVQGHNELFRTHDVALPFLQAAVSQDHSTGLSLITAHYYGSGDLNNLTDDLVSLIRDLLILKSGGNPQCQQALLKSRIVLSELVEIRQLSAAMSALWDLKGRQRHPDMDQLSLMSMCFVLLSSVFTPQDQPHIPQKAQNGSVPTQEAALSMDALRALLSPVAAVPSFTP